MGLRTILYGYKRNHLCFNIIQEEADVVRKIFNEYISGKTMKSIADDLSADGIVYYKDKSNWTKNAICRILENEHYAGDYDYPAIISKEVYLTANCIKTSKGGKRVPDDYETALLKRKIICAECGHRYTRRKNYVSNRERWECSNYCKLSFFLDDKALYNKLTTLLNRIIENPDELRYSVVGDLFEPTMETIRQDREIERITNQKNTQFLPVKRAIYDAASGRYDCCRLDLSKAVTDKLIEYVGTLKKTEKPDFSLIEAIVKKIIVNTNGILSFKFINDKIVDEIKEKCNANDNDKP